MELAVLPLRVKSFIITWEPQHCANYTILPEISVAKIRSDAPFDKVCFARIASLPHNKSETFNLSLLMTVPVKRMFNWYNSSLDSIKKS